MTPERIARLQAVLERRQPDLTVVSDFVHKPRNLSAILRCCDAAGVLQLHAVLGDSDYRAFRGTARGSQQWVGVRRHNRLEDALTPLQQAGYQLVVAHLSAESVDYRDIDYTPPTALILGAERRGPGPLARSAARHIVIPMVGMVESLNVSVAAGIILSEAQRQRQLAGMYDRSRLDGATRERLFFEWGHPGVRDFCRQRGLAYPPLDAEGEIADPVGWNASVQDGSAPREDYGDE
ncbi:tRNA (guanosine(18)-2'-O)-methyltransferase TrmH [Haliea sp. E17]|uniref:tRNA (guanosine(18)-2'-O)-methyltransferase TrmH n=1 Tax=Haliea sp. E17 TaxID=3401576 RepID=UPI003AAD4AF8